MEQIILHSISADEFNNRFDKLEKQIELAFNLKTNSSSTDGEQRYLSRKEVGLILKISLPTLNTWTKEGKLQSYRIGTRILYKPDEVNKALIRRELKFIKQ